MLTSGAVSPFGAAFSFGAALTFGVALTSSSSSFLSSLELSDEKVDEPYIPARLGTASHFCEVVVLKC